MSEVVRMRAGRGFAGPRRVAGVGMIEVLIAVVLLAFGMLGIAALQMAALRSSQSSLQRSQATISTYAILDAMRANRDEARIGGYNLATKTCAVPDPGSLAKNDLAEWMGSLKQVLGDSACAKIVCGNDKCEIEISWTDARAKDDPNQSVTTVTRL
ncbi:MAG TPA: type IV pilus modification protein PilV [Pseudoxanthomonas sp.]|nr:type IV pilus modification protein PilV [Pseudoxanthomonas sp.]